jgi:hypothetical protein
MRSYFPAIFAVLALAVAKAQFNNGPGNFFTFTQGAASSQAAPAVRSMKF